MWRAVKNRVASAIGTLTKKIARQETASASQPPKVGATTPAIAVAPAQVPIALPRSCSGKVAPMMARLVGTMSALPTPWITRAMTSASMPGAIPHPIDPAANTTMPAVKMRLRPKRSPAAPPIRASAALTST